LVNNDTNNTIIIFIFYTPGSKDPLGKKQKELKPEAGWLYVRCVDNQSVVQKHGIEALNRDRNALE